MVSNISSASLKSIGEFFPLSFGLKYAQPEALAEDGSGHSNWTHAEVQEFCANYLSACLSPLTMLGHAFEKRLVKDWVTGGELGLGIPFETVCIIAGVDSDGIRNRLFALGL